MASDRFILLDTLIICRVLLSCIINRLVVLELLASTKVDGESVDYE